MTALEREVQDRQGNWFALRIRPYKNVENRIDGAVLALFDVDALHRQEGELRDLLHYAEEIVQVTGQPLVVLDDALRVRTANPAFLRLFGHAGEDIRGRAFEDIADSEWKTAGVKHALERLADGDQHAVALPHVTPHGGGPRLRTVARRIDGPPGRPPLILLVFDQGEGAEADDGKA